MFLRLIALGVSCGLLLSACQGFPLWRKETARSAVPPDPAARVKLEFQGLAHDETSLYGRLLVGVEGGKALLDKRLPRNVSVSVESVWTCDTRQSVPVVFADYVTRPPTQEHLLVLEPGYWYGRDLSFLLFGVELTGQPAPDCVEVEFSLRSFDGDVLARASFRSHRKAVAPAPEPPPAPPAVRQDSLTPPG